MMTTTTISHDRIIVRALLLLISVYSILTPVNGHGFLKSPRSRNYYASVEGVNWGGGPGVPPAEYCPHCINLKEETQVCGTGQAQNYDTWKDTNGNPMPWMSQGTYTEGGEIIIEATLTTNHAGHIDVFVCPDGDSSTQECFWNNPLTFVEDLLHGGPVDNDYPERAYVAPVTDLRFKYRLPMGIYGNKVMLQWRYVTANSCFPPGYERPELGLRARGWLRSTGMANCRWPLNPTGLRDNESPEQFWNCADISINPASPTASPSPSIEQFPIPTTTEAPQTAPVQVPSPTTDGCCTWDNGGSCGPTWCNDSKSNCEGSCNGSYIGEGAPTVPTAPIAPIAPTPTAPTNPTRGQTATTTRYWDCSGGACGCAYLPFGTGTDKQPAHCYSNAMFEAPFGNPYGAKFYGTAAISQELGGGDWMAEGCGKCWKVRGWSNIPNKDIFQTTLILKGTNYCPPANELCSGNKAHFDISAPGFDVTQFSLSNSCKEREADEIEGFESCGRWMIDDQNSDNGCECSKFKDPVLRAGCDNFYSLLWDNSEVDYEEVVCPEELTRLNCWEENGNKYPEGIPEFCASNVGESTPTPPTPTPPTPTPPTNECEDSPSKFKLGKKRRNCDWVNNRKEKQCTKSKVAWRCPITCETCNCFDLKKKFKVKDLGKIKCNAARKDADLCSKEKVAQNCPVSCRTCDQPNPTAPPVESPTVVGGGDSCCSQNLKTCHSNDWCNADQAQCASCSGRWILKNTSCDLAWWDDCKGNTNGCCPPAKCVDFGYWAQCRA